MRLQDQQQLTQLLPWWGICDRSQEGRWWFLKSIFYDFFWYIFTPVFLGNDSISLAHMFPLGSFNHQLDNKQLTTGKKKCGRLPPPPKKKKHWWIVHNSSPSHLCCFFFDTTSTRPASNRWLWGSSSRGLVGIPGGWIGLGRKRVSFLEDLCYFLNLKDVYIYNFKMFQNSLPGFFFLDLDVLSFLARIPETTHNYRFNVSWTQ